MYILFTICARAGSKGVKSKNIRKFLEYPIAYYTLSVYWLFMKKYGNDYDQIDLAVNTDSHELVEQIKKTKVPFIYVERKDFLGGDAVSKTDVIKDTLHVIENLKCLHYDMIVDLDLTSPLRKVEDIKGIIELLNNNFEADVAFSATNSRRLPFFNMVLENINGYCEPVINKGYISRQQAPKCFDMNASIYAYRNRFISSSETTKVFDGKAVMWKMKDTAVLDIDCEEDLELMQVLASYFYDKYNEFGEVYREIKHIL